MKKIIRAEEVLEKGQTAVVIFTRGSDLEIYDDGSGRGHSGFWKIGLYRKYDKVVIYLREEDGRNIIYTADVEDIGDEQNGRYKLFLTNIEEQAETSSNWWAFTGNKSSYPIKYLTG